MVLPELMVALDNDQGKACTDTPGTPVPFKTGNSLCVFLRNVSVVTAVRGRAGCLFVCLQREIRLWMAPMRFPFYGDWHIFFQSAGDKSVLKGSFTYSLISHPRVH